MLGQLRDQLPPGITRSNHVGKGGTPVQGEPYQLLKDSGRVIYIDDLKSVVTVRKNESEELYKIKTDYMEYQLRVRKYNASMVEGKPLDYWNDIVNGPLGIRAPHALVGEVPASLHNALADLWFNGVYSEEEVMERVSSWFSNPGRWEDDEDEEDDSGSDF